MKVETLTVLIDAKNIETVDHEHRKPLIDMHLAELKRLGVECVDCSVYERNREVLSGFPKIGIKDCTSNLIAANNLLLTDANGVVLDGQTDVEISSKINDVVTAKVTFLIGGFVRLEDGNG